MAALTNVGGLLAAAAVTLAVVDHGGIDQGREEAKAIESSVLASAKFFELHRSRGTYLMINASTKADTLEIQPLCTVDVTSVLATRLARSMKTIISHRLILTTLNTRYVIG